MDNNGGGVRWGDGRGEGEVDECWVTMVVCDKEWSEKCTW